MCIFPSFTSVKWNPVYAKGPERLQTFGTEPLRISFALRNVCQK